jgi:hypothetical protein
MLMGERNDPNIFFEANEDYRIRKPFDQNLSGINCWVKIDDWGGSKWRLNETFHRLLDCAAELIAKTRALTIVSLLCLDQLVLRLVKDDDTVAHSRRRSRRSRTSGQVRPFATPDRTLSTRRLISFAHAASTASSGSPSKLASNAAASSARSVVESRMALFRMSSVVLLIVQIVAPDPTVV